MTQFSSTDYRIVPETKAHDDAIHALHSEAFGPGAVTRAAFRLREQGPHCRERSLVALDHENALIGTVRLTPILIGREAAWLLGPLAVEPALKGRGVGRALTRAACDSVFEPVLLVGDQAYYGSLGFKPATFGQVIMPGPVDPARLLVFGLSDEKRATLSGIVRHRGPV